MMTGVKLWLHDEDNDKWTPAASTPEGILKVEMSGAYTPDIVIITDGAGHYLELPELTEAERDALTPNNGTVIYNSDDDTVDVFIGGVWLPLAVHPHATAHENGGTDEISVAGLSGQLADDQHVLDAEVLAVAAALVHKVRHQNGGADEINVGGLSGQLADDQPVLDAQVLAVAAALVHAARHENGGADEISVAGLSGQLADDQPVLDAQVRAVSIEHLVEDGTPQLGGELDMNEKSIKYTAALDTDEKYSGLIVTGTFGTDVVFGQLLYLSSDAAGKWKLAKADALATCCEMLGIALEAGGDTDTGLILLQGFIRDDSWDFAFEGYQLYISPSTAGLIVIDIPFVATQFVRIVGYVWNADVIYFNPDNTYIKRS